MSEQNNSGKIGLSTATITGANAMIGAGIFAAPIALASNVGPAGILAYIFVVFSVWFLAQSFARVAQLYPQEGSFYTYTKQWGGHKMGLASAFAYLIGLSVAMGLVAQVAGETLQYFFPNTSTSTLGLIIIAIIVILNLFGAEISQLGQRILIVCTVFSLLAATIMGFTKIDLNMLEDFAPYGYGNVFKALPKVLFGFFGFECASSLFSIVKNPEKNVPKALTYSILFVGILYTLFVSSIILSTPMDAFSSGTVSLPQILQLNFPNQGWLITLITVSMLSAMFGTIHSVIWSMSGLLVSLVKKINTPFTQKAVSSHMLNLQTSVLTISVIVFGSFIAIKNQDLFFDITALMLVFAYVTSIITLLTIKKEWKSGQNIKTIMGIITALVMFGFALKGTISGLL